LPHTTVAENNLADANRIRFYLVPRELLQAK